MSFFISTGVTQGRMCHSGEDFVAKANLPDFFPDGISKNSLRASTNTVSAEHGITLEVVRQKSGDADQQSS
jgi:hypothetical protein